MNDDKVKLGVLWKNVSRTGNKPYLAGRVHQESLDAAVQLLRAGGRFLILSNRKRPDKQDPDCELFVVPERDAREGSAPAATVQGPGAAERTAPRPSPGPRAAR